MRKDVKAIGTKLQEIAKNVTTGGEYLPIGELSGFPVLVKTEALEKDSQELKQNHFFIEGVFKYTYNNGQIAMSDHKAVALNFLNALERIPKLIEQYRAQNATLERDIPALQEVVNGTWRKEEDLKKLKSEFLLKITRRFVFRRMLGKYHYQINVLLINTFYCEKYIINLTIYTNWY